MNEDPQTKLFYCCAQKGPQEAQKDASKLCKLCWLELSFEYNTIQYKLCVIYIEHMTKDMK